MAGLLRALYMCCVFIEIVMGKPNIVLVLTDDQDLMLGGMIPMTKTIKNIANWGVTFSNAFVNSPLCCPSRSTLLTGKYPHNTGVVNNSVKGGCASDSWRQNQEPNTIAAWLNKAGYQTFYAGKYLNEYGTKSSGNDYYVPVGWDHWYGLVGNSKYYNYTLVENGKPVHYTNSYLTDVIKDKALHFLSRSSRSLPFFMFLSVPAPHAPSTPAPRHKSEYPNVKATRTPAFNSTPVDKHWLLRQQPTPLPTEAEAVLDDVQRHRLQSLLAVDELIDEIYFRLLLNKRLHDTYIIFTSDNGYHIGQFSQPWDKRQPYDTDIRVPLIISGPFFPMKLVTPVVVQFVDLAPTILDIAELRIPSNMDGRSFLGLINKKKFNSFLIEYQGEGNAKSNDEKCPSKTDDSLAECGWDSWCKCQDSLNNTYNCVRQLSPKTDFLFCQFLDSENFIEAYDLRSDKYQMNNIYKNMKPEDVNFYLSLLNRLTKCQGSECRLKVI